MEKQIINELMLLVKHFSETQKMNLGISVVERMLAAYFSFSEKYHFGDVAFLNESLLALKTGLSAEESAERLEYLEGIAPDTDDFPSNYMATAALDTCAGFYELFLMSQDQDAEHLEIIFSLALNIPYMYLCSQTKTPYQDPRMEKEVSFLKTLVGQIKENKPLQIAENEWVDRIRKVA
jgi:uncharacterized protein YjaG (DUF416 family)